MTKPRSETALHAQVRDLLHAAGLRRTPARERVLAHLSRCARPLAHSEISGARGGEPLDRVTLYRTLAALEDAGLVHRVQDQEGAWRFCAHVRRDHGCPGNHAHFQCTQCGEMRCLQGQELPWVSIPPGALVIGKQFLIYGLCPACARAQSGRRRK
jgi:Fur family transcriptional regulator, ferric uptake regulator